jgi:UDP:flavonoid glycosyltransferase YjiC (YdhE family)
LTTYVPAEPIPEMAADCGEPPALSATEIEAVRLAAEAGVNVTVIVQVAPTASELPQLFDCPKLLAFVPVTEMLEMVRAAVPGFDNVMGSAAAAVPTRVLGKASGFGLSTA